MVSLENCLGVTSLSSPSSILINSDKSLITLLPALTQKYSINSDSWVPFAPYTDGWGAHAFRDGNHREGDAGNRTISQKSMHRTWSRYYVRIAMKK